MFSLSIISAVLCITSVVNIFVLATAWRRRDSRTGLYFLLAMTGITVWTLAAALDYAAIPLSLKIFFAKIEALGYLTAIPLIVRACISFAGNDHWMERKWIGALFLLVPAGSILLVWTNELHGGIWTGFVPAENGSYVFERGPAYGWMSAAYYLQMVLILFNLWDAFRKGRGVVKRQASLMTFAALFPLATNLAYQAGVGSRGVDWTSVTFSVSGMTFLYALYGVRLLDIRPIARDQLINSLGDGLIVLDVQNRVIDMNGPGELLFPGVKTGAPFAPHVLFASDLLHKAYLHETRVEITMAGSEKRYFDVMISPVEDNGEVVGKMLVFHNITDRKKNELRLLQLEQAVEQSPTSVVITDIGGNITYVNPRFMQITGYTQEEIVGQNPRVIQSGKTSPEVYSEMWQTIRSGKPWRGELLNKAKNGRLFWELEVLAPVFDLQGAIVNYIAVKEDITERKLATKTLEENRKFLADLIEYSGSSIFVKDLAGRYELVNSKWEEVTGLKRADIIGLTDADIFPGHTSADFQSSDAEALRLGRVIEKEETLDSGAATRYFITTKFPLRAADGSFNGVCGMSTEITNRKRAEKELEENRRFLADLVEHSGASIFIKGLDGRYSLVNRKYEELTGLQRAEVIARSDAELFSAESAARFQADDQRVITSGKSLEVEDFIGNRYLITVKFPLRSADGGFIGVCGISTDITERKQLENALQLVTAQMKDRLEEIGALQESLREQAIRDPLTQLHNRHFLNETVDHEFHRAARLAQPLSIVMLDIDHFKAVNDAFGHVAGDACLITLAQLLLQNTRKSDIACRYGGEEFLLLLPDTDAEAAQKHSEKLRILFAELSTSYNGREIRNTISLGVACYPQHGTDYKEIINKADQALYTSKNAGRNRATVWSE